ncbi:hypothetical protein [Streptomyces hirsutus]|uniref:hypothetical protein n=1 Tax=Streptomyces hirsutus TaxID=35620 RepID=UPI0036365705
MVMRTGVFGVMTREHREQFISLAREVSFAEGGRILNEGGKADRLWTHPHGHGDSRPSRAGTAGSGR